MRRGLSVGLVLAGGLLLALAAGFVIVVAQAFSPGIVGWVAFGVTGVFVLAMMAATGLARDRGVAQRTLDASSPSLPPGRSSRASCSRER